jgi:hypothetical protein
VVSIYPIEAQEFQHHGLHFLHPEPSKISFLDSDLKTHFYDEPKYKKMDCPKLAIPYKMATPVLLSKKY